MANKKSRRNVFGVIVRTATAFVLAASLGLAGAGTAFAAPVVPYWDEPEQQLPISANLLTTYGVRAGSAGPDFLGISNTNFDFTAGTATSPDQYPVPGAATLNSVTGAGLAIWSTSVNENTNPYYQNLYYDAVTPGATATQATTWMSNSQASWGDSNGSASTNFYTGNSTIAGLEYNPDIIFGANKITGWLNASSDGTGSNTIIEEYYDSNPSANTGATWTSNDATNIWGQIYTLNQLAQVADNLTDGTGKSTRYDNSSAAVSALNYEKAIQGNLLYLASLIDAETLQEKTVAYLYAIDSDGVGYFFTPKASDLLYGDDTGAAGDNSASNPDPNYAANNATIDMGYMATLPFVTNTFDSGTAFTGGIIMGVEDIYKANPACMVISSDPGALADVDIIIYNTTVLRGTDLIGSQDGKNDSGIDMNSYYSPTYINSWAQSHGFSGTLIAGDDYYTSTNQGYEIIDTTPAGMAPLLYCQDDYTADKNARAAWAFAQVYPEAYDNNPDATYAYWVDKIYHIKLADVPTVAQYMTNKSTSVVYDHSTAYFLEINFETGLDWWNDTGTNDPNWSQFAHYNGSSRASYYSDDLESEEPTDTIAILAPSSLWIEGTGYGGGGYTPPPTPPTPPPTPPAHYAYSIGYDYGGKSTTDIHDYVGDSTDSAYYAATTYGMIGYSSWYSFLPTYGYINGANPGGKGRLESDVIFLCGHANPYCVLFGDTEGSPDNMCGVYYYEDQDNRDYSGYWYVGLQQPGRDISGVKLISFIGCDTAGYPDDEESQADNLCTRATDRLRENGNYAGAALGFVGSTYPFYCFDILSTFSADPNNESGPMWIKRYNDALAAGDTVEGAANYANVIMTKDGWGFSFHIAGDKTTTIAPP